MPPFNTIQKILFLNCFSIVLQAADPNRTHTDLHVHNPYGTGTDYKYRKGTHNTKTPCKDEDTDEETEDFRQHRASPPNYLLYGWDAVRAQFLPPAYEPTPELRIQDPNNQPYHSPGLVATPNPESLMTPAQPEPVHTNRPRNAKPAFQTTSLVKLHGINIAQAKNKINTMVQNNEFSRLSALKEQSPLVFNEIMQHKGFGAKMVTQCLHPSEHPHPEKDLASRSNFLKLFMSYVSTDELQAINPKTGQAILHAFCRWHHQPDIAELLFTREHLDLAIQTTEPDKYPGSTLAAIVAAYIYNSKAYFRNNPYKTNARSFLVTCFNKIPHIMTLTSRGDDNTPPISCWQLIPKKEQNLMLPMLTEHAKALAEKIDTSTTQPKENVDRQISNHRHRKK